MLLQGHQSAVLSNYQRESNPELIFQHSKELVAKIGYLRVITPRMEQPLQSDAKVSAAMRLCYLQPGTSTSSLRLPLHFSQKPRSLRCQASSKSPISYCSRRDVAMAMSMLMVARDAPASAGPIGDSIAAAWRSRQQANRDVIIAPIKVAQERLEAALLMLDGAQSPEQFATVLQAVRASSMNCYLYEALPDDSFETRASLVTQQLQFSDPCTYRLIVKNVTGLSNEAEASKGSELVATLLRHYQKLDGELESVLQGSGAVGQQRVREQLGITLEVVGQLEQYVRGVLA
ncbi:hypothetical protein QJQ45_026820 [Haematococcus lacustris]|nr:hypothetical protein QJQ45_026820 [Haematococcus lacustris]